MGDQTPGNGECDDWFNPVISMVTQVSSILVISHFFHILLKPIGQPGPVAQILAGFVIGPSGLSKIPKVEDFFFPHFASDYYETMMLYARIIIMFQIGLEMDFPYMKRNLRPASIIAFCSCLMCTIFAAAMTSYVKEEVAGKDSHSFMLGLMITVVLANTASPVMARVAADLKIGTSDVGRMAVSSSLIGDMYAVFLLALISRSKKNYSIGLWIFLGFVYFGIVVGVIVLNTYVTKWLNRRNMNKKYLTNAEFASLLAILFVTAMALESMGYSSIIGCLLIGAMFPRGGKASRTMLIKLTYSVNTFVLPVYFGFSGFRANVTSINTIGKACIIFLTILLGVGGKIIGTLAACSMLKIPLNEGVFIAFLMNLKGHVDLLTLSVALQDRIIMDIGFYEIMISAVVLNTLLWGPIITYLVKRENDLLGYKHIAFESQNPVSEIRLVACVHSPRPVATTIGLINASRGGDTIPLTSYLMHLVELPEKTKTNLMYHQKAEDELSDDDDYGGNDVVQINDAVDIYTSETGITIYQVKVVSPIVSMYIDVCELAIDIRASIIILPFHKHQRIDGKMETGKEGIRITNQKVLRHAQCSVAILVDRGLASGSSRVSGVTESLHQVATLFFGGADDREALGFSKRLGMHEHVSLTIIRFLPASAGKENVGVGIDSEDKDIRMAMPDHQNDADNAALTEFYTSYVTSGQVGFVEKQIQNGADTASFLRDMADVYSLFIVGKGGGRNSPLTTGMSDWEECPELGSVGDFLSSPEFDLSGSVIVIQQYRSSKNDDSDNP